MTHTTHTHSPLPTHPPSDEEEPDWLTEASHHHARKDPPGPLHFTHHHPAHDHSPGSLIHHYSFDGQDDEEARAHQD